MGGGGEPKFSGRRSVFVVQGMDEPQSHSGCRDEEKDLNFPAGTESLTDI
jgi:hypothetical protein